MSQLTANEQKALLELRQVMDALKRHLEMQTLTAEDSLQIHFQVASQIKALFGHHDNRMSAIAAALARQFLGQEHDLVPYDSCERHQNASGLDVQCQTSQGKSIIAEIKTTVPSQGRRLGAVQVKNIRKDLERLSAQTADFKYFFVVNPETQRETEKLLERHSYDQAIRVVNVAEAPPSFAALSANLSP